MDVDRESGLVAEMALGARSLVEFENQWLGRVCAQLGFETACSVRSGEDGRVLAVTSVGYDERVLFERFPRYMEELSEQELARFSTGAPALDTDVVTPARRERLTVYRELLGPAGVACFVTSVWRSRWGVFGYHFGRTTLSRPFIDSDRRALSKLSSIVKVGQALLVSDERINAALSQSNWWVSEWRLSPREVETVQLVMRGLRNQEIAALLRVSAHTIRNHLVNVFRKAAVSNRAELVFLVNSPPTLVLRSLRDRLGHNAWRAFLTADSGS